ncbi:hypothetical protein Forpi1262_v016314 [Fusarium oxysporum f. sp. raphani]|uniref:Uncharacterized protein n=1 Tax=Fusarium oxysporum f. sp. raphani TaxID=96318 RepID=A0A8J5PCK4_FUSOX|nr:hypothetical protein Forpi1262_v016314 [Fusarium oxysporum f. sp. raphani]
MPVQLLPASAAAFAPRASSVNVALGSKVEPSLTQTLKRINRVKRPLNSVLQHQRCLTETLSSPNAIWTLTSLMLPKTPESGFKRDASNHLFEAIMNYELVHVEAYVVHVDMVLRNEVSYKLTKDTIDALVEYHKEIHCVDAKASTYDWTGKEQQCKRLHEDFVQDINKFVFCTHVSALEGLEEGGTGELLCGKSEEVKNCISALIKPLLPPSTPCVVEVVRQPTLLSSSLVKNIWSQHGLCGNLVAVDSWSALPSSPSIPSWADSNTSPMTMSDVSPTPAFTHSLYDWRGCSTQVTVPIPALPLLIMLPPANCDVSVGMEHMSEMRDLEYATRGEDSGT